MNAEIFEDTMRSFIRHRPFQPFVVELEEGQEILVDDPHAVALSGGGTGGAGYIGADEVYMISAELVRAIRPVRQNEEVRN